MAAAPQRCTSVLSREILTLMMLFGELFGMVASNVCYLNQEMDKGGKLRWVMPLAGRGRRGSCSCTSIRPGGVSMYTHGDEDHFTNHPLFTADPEEVLKYFNCQMCPVDLEEPLGMEEGNISDDSIKMSSYYSARHVKARLNAQGYPAAWSALLSDSHPWIQVDFKTEVFITGLITQGRDSKDGYKQWVKTYEVSLSSDGQLFSFVSDGDGSHVKFNGNVDGDTQVTVRFQETLNTRVIRINPTDWNNHCSMRFEVIGCLISN